MTSLLSFTPGVVDNGIWFIWPPGSFCTQNLTRAYLTAFFGSKGQIKPKADWRTVDSPKKRTNEFGFFCHKIKKKNTISFVWFLGESTASQSAYGFIWPLKSLKICWITKEKKILFHWMFWSRQKTKSLFFLENRSDILLLEQGKIFIVVHFLFSTKPHCRVEF